MHKHELGSLHLRDIVDCLISAYGSQGWWPAENRFEMIVSAILTQRVSWANAKRAIHRLREAHRLSVEAMLATSEDELSELIRPARYHNAKARKLHAFCRFVRERQHDGNPLDALLSLPAACLRDTLLTVHGIGPETADAIVLYAAGKPAFVVDAYARRILMRLGWVEPASSDDAIRHRALVELSNDVPLLGEVHALLVEHGKRHCLLRNPRCLGCVLQPQCGSGNGATKGACRCT